MEAYGRVSAGPHRSGAYSPSAWSMRVIPIQSAIDGESRKAITKRSPPYLEENHQLLRFPLHRPHGPREHGERMRAPQRVYVHSDGPRGGVNTSVPAGARPITREEAYEILKRAEENGPMKHEIPNTDGPGKTHASATAAAAAASPSARRRCSKTWTWSVPTTFPR
jgi:hypothetical protein